MKRCCAARSDRFSAVKIAKRRRGEGDSDGRHVSILVTVRVSTPLILACLAGLYSERSGIVDIGLEGKLIASAFGAAVVTAVTGSAWAGLLAGSGYRWSFRRSRAGVHQFQGNRSFRAWRSTSLPRTSPFWGQRGSGAAATPPFRRRAFLRHQLPFAAELRNVPIVGPIYSGLISGHTIALYRLSRRTVTAWVLSTQFA